jgi:hypothetical protein
LLNSRHIDWKEYPTATSGKQSRVGALGARYVSRIPGIMKKKHRMQQTKKRPTWREL